MHQNKGFTLLELLVVVLIIGILASVALPQYKRVVRKTRFVQGITAVKSIIDAQQIYLMNNGTVASNLSELDITLPAGALSYFKDIIMHIDGTIPPHIQMRYYENVDGKDIFLVAYFEGTARPNIVCALQAGTAANSPARKLCQDAMGTKESFLAESGWDGYALSY